MPRQEVGTNCTELKDKLPREQPVAAGQQRRRQRCACQFFAAMALQLGTHLAHDGGWRQIRQLCDVVELPDGCPCVFGSFVSWRTGHATL